jgi:hypothetical protein
LFVVRASCRNTVAVAAAAAWKVDDLVTNTTVADVRWNLRTWPLDLVLWPTFNDHRQVGTVPSSGCSRVGW